MKNDRAQIAIAVRSALVALRLQSNGLSPAAVDSIVSAPVPSIHAEAINDAGRDVATPAKAIIATIVAFFLYMSILLYGQNMLSGVIEEKMSRVSEIVISSVKPETLLAGKVIGVTAVGLTQQLVWVGGTIALISARTMLFGAPAVAKAQAAAAGGGGGFGSSDLLAAVVATPWSWVALVLVFFLLGVLFYGALYAAVGATVGSEQDARQAAFPVVMLLVITAVLISPTVQNPTSNLAITYVAATVLGADHNADSNGDRERATDSGDRKRRDSPRQLPGRSLAGRTDLSRGTAHVRQAADAVGAAEMDLRVVRVMGTRSHAETRTSRPIAVLRALLASPRDSLLLLSLRAVLIECVREVLCYVIRRTPFDLVPLEHVHDLAVLQQTDLR